MGMREPVPQLQCCGSKRSVRVGCLPAASIDDGSLQMHIGDVYAPRLDTHIRMRHPAVNVLLDEVAAVAASGNCVSKLALARSISNQ